MQKQFTDSELEKIWEEVPADYYQNGVKNNILQKYWHTHKLKAVSKLIDNHPHNILDVGCASGWFLNELSQIMPKTKCTGIDPYKKAIDYAKSNYPHIEFILADAHSLPFPDASFDTIICTEVLEHVVDPKKVLKEIRRVLKDDGLAVIEMDTGNLLFSTIWFFWTKLRKGVWRDAHIQKFNKNILRNMILEEGFQIKSTIQFNWSMAIAFSAQKTKSK